jgi:hypothetical protein
VTVLISPDGRTFVTSNPTMVRNLTIGHGYRVVDSDPADPSDPTPTPDPAPEPDPGTPADPAPGEPAPSEPDAQEDGR